VYRLYLIKVGIDGARKGVRRWCFQASRYVGMWVLMVGYHQAVLAPTRLDDSCFHGQWKRYDLDLDGQKEEVVLQRFTVARKPAEAFVGYFYLEGQQVEGTQTLIIRA
jgi:hypothetical protein